MIDVHAAHTFMHRNARAIDRACAQAMLDASCVGTARVHILAYRNDDGGFGQCLEPDLRTPHSQPLHTEVALYMLRDLATPEPDIANAAAQWLGTVADGAHTSAYLPGALDYPAAPHWQSGFGATPNMARTLVLLPALAWHSCTDPWFEAASAAAAQFLCDHTGAPELADAHLLQGAIWAACAVLDGAQLELTLAALMAQLVQAPHFNAMPAAEYGLSPLDYAPSPTSACAQLFTQSQVTAHLDHIEQTQSDDGGWPIAFEPSSPAAEWEWRGSITLKHLRILHAYGRI